MKKLVTPFLLLSCLSLFFISCKPSNDGPQPQLISGIAMRNINADPTGTMGSPNVLTVLNGINMICYPNPCVTQLDINMSIPQASTIKIWMVAAEYKNAPDSIKVQNQSLYSHQSNPPVSFTETVNAGVYTHSIQTDSLPGGFYKLYAVVNTDTLYDAIWIYRQ